MRIVIYGAAGLVGRGVRAALARDHELVLVDRVSIDKPEGPAVQGDVCDPELFCRTAPGADGLVYLPYAQYSPRAPDESTAYDGASFDVNVRGVYYCLAAARESNVSRVVYTSTMGVFDLRDTQQHDLDEDVPPLPHGRYGLTKWFGEEVCRYFARRYGMNVVVLRLCNVTPAAAWAGRRSRPSRLPRTHVDDVGRAVALAASARLEGFQLINVFGDWPDCDWSHERAEKLLGFMPSH